MVSDRAFIFHIYIPWGKTLYSVPKSRSSVKANIKVRVFENMADAGASNTACFDLDMERL